MSVRQSGPNELVVESIDLSSAEHQAGLLELLNDYALTEFGTGRPLERAVLQQLVDGLRQCDNYRGFLALQAGTPVGLANCFTGYSTFRAQSLLNVHDLCVHHQWRGRGIGRQLLTTVATYAKDQGFCRVTLEVRSDNTVAKRLYESLGFVSGLPQGKTMEFLTKSLSETSS